MKDSVSGIISNNLKRSNIILTKISKTLSDIKDLKKLSIEINSPESILMLDFDPYWPKWNTPFWKSLFLVETGNGKLIPDNFVELLLKKIDLHYIKFFPKLESEIPKGIDPYRHILCFCALANFLKISFSKHIDAFLKFPWLREIIIDNILPDGGWNCDEGAYNKSMKSSFQTTIVMAEALIMHYMNFKDASLLPYIDKAWNYFILHKVFLSSSGNSVNDDWKKMTFPRFYEFDVLRGLSFLAEWAEIRNNKIPVSVLKDALFTIDSSLDKDGMILINREWLEDEFNIVFEDDKWEGNKKPSMFPLLSKYSKKGESLYLTREWYETINKLESILI